MLLTIRQYKPEDHDDVWALHNAALLAVGAHAGNGPWDDDLHTIEQVYLYSGGEFLVGMLEERVVAMGALRRTTVERAEVKRMRVDPVWQRRGFGERLLLALEECAVRLGYHTLQLDTTMQNHAAIRFYEKLGWKETSRDEWQGWQLIYYEKSIVKP